MSGVAGMANLRYKSVAQSAAKKKPDERAARRAPPWGHRGD